MGSFKRYLPDRKVLSGGLASLAAYGVVVAARSQGMEVPFDLAAAVIGGAGSAVAYIVPPSVNDVLRRGDDFVRKIGEAQTP